MNSEPVPGNVRVLGIDEIIANLQQANANALISITNNNNFNSKLNADLTSINAQITAIGSKIQELQQTLQDMRGQVADNQSTIEQNEQEKQRFEQRISEAQRERDSVSQELQDNQQQRAQLQQELEETKISNQEQRDRLKEQVDQYKADLENASETEKRRLLEEIADAQEEMQNLERANAQEVQKIQGELAALNDEKNSLTAELASSKSDIDRLTSQSSDLQMSIGELRQQNADLNNKLELARIEMTAAIENLRALSENPTQNGSQQLITDINAQLQRINDSLGIVGEEQYFDAAEGGLPYNTRIDQTYISNGATRKKTFNLGDFIDVLQNNIDKYKSKNGRNEQEHIRSILPHLRNASNMEAVNDYIEQIKNTNEGAWNTIMSNSQLRGGRKTRRKGKVGRKTRKGKKMQRGGFHYSQRAKRRSITTTSSSRRSTSRRSSRRHSSRKGTSTL
jgi:chromosome segregation ATPase